MKMLENVINVISNVKNVKQVERKIVQNVVQTMNSQIIQENVNQNQQKNHAISTLPLKNVAHVINLAKHVMLQQILIVQNVLNQEKKITTIYVNVQLVNTLIKQMKI